jgi:hypothetical protein
MSGYNQSDDSQGEALFEEDEPRQPFVVHCGKCKHEWPAFYFPLALDKKGLRLMNAAATTMASRPGRGMAAPDGLS